MSHDEKDLISVSLKIILTLGMVRSNIEDYLIVLTFLDKNLGLNFLDLTEEIRAFSTYYGCNLK